jgi:tetratricopeptide repeat protein
MNVTAMLRTFMCGLTRAVWHGRWGWYHTVPLVVLWATYVLHRYRVLGNVLVAALPVVAAIVMGFWLVLVTDELVHVVRLTDRLARVVRGVKRASLAAIGAYAALACVVWANGDGEGPVVRRPAHVLSRTNARLGSARYAWWTLGSSERPGDVHRVLWSSKDDADAYVGGDVELVLRRGRVWLWRVLEVRRDHERYLLTMLEAAPASRTALAGLVRLYAARQDFDRAMQWYTTLTRAYPDEPDVGYSLGGALVESRRYRDGVAVFRQVLAMRRDYESLYGLGYALAWAGEKREAATYLREATTLDGEDYRAFYSLGYVLLATGEYRDAHAAWSRVLELVPVFPEVQQNLRQVEKRISLSGTR